MKVHHKSRKSNRGWIKLAALATLLVAGCRTSPQPPPPARALQVEEIDLTRIVPATMKTFNADGRSAYIWWLPPQLLRALTNKLRDEGNSNSSVRGTLDDYLTAADDYCIVAAGGSVKGPGAQQETVTRETIRQQLRLVDAAGNLYRPIPIRELPLAVQQFMAMIGLAFGDAAPQFGGQMHVFAFPARNGEGSLLVQPLKDGQFQIHLGDFEARWHLPLGALLAPRQCPVCNRVFPGNYDFCPIDRAALENRAPLSRSK